jgi:hypothetical protein
MKIFNCENFLPCKGYPEISKCTVLAETIEVALGLALEKFPDMPKDNWEIVEVEWNGEAKIIFEEHLSY